MNEDSKVYDVSLSYLEIYNETIKDLLVPYGTSKSLLLREDADKRINVPGLTCLCPKNVCPPARFRELVELTVYR